MRWPMFMTIVFLMSAACVFGAEKPNIIFILTDDQGIGSTSPETYGGVYSTPHLDALARHGLLFTHAYAEPLCRPSRATILSGRYAHETGIVNNDDPHQLDPRHFTALPKALQQAGYATAHAGKWHLSYLWDMPTAALWGWDTYITAPHHKASRYWQPMLVQDGQPLSTGPDDYGPDIVHKFVLDFIRKHQDRPFFVNYAMFHPHGPFVKTPESTPNSDIYADYIAYPDKLVGSLLYTLKRFNLLHKTLIIYAGDNGSIWRPEGYLIDGKHIDGWKSTLREGGSRVPFIAYWDGVTPKNTVIDDLIDFTDIYPTLLEVAGVKQTKGLSGVSFAPQLHGRHGTPRMSVYVHVNDEGYTRFKTTKIYTDGRLCDMSMAPYEEKCQ